MLLEVKECIFTPLHIAGEIPAMWLIIYNYHILFRVIWHIISPRKGTVARGEAEGHSTFTRGDNMPYYPESNVIIILLHNSLKNCYLTIHGAELYAQVFAM